MKTKIFFLGCMFLSLICGPLLVYAQEGDDSEPGKVNLKLEFGASVVSVDNDGVFDSLTDAGFDEDESGISIGYDRELFGGAASLKFSAETLRMLDGEIGDMFGDGPLSLDELYVWVKPFGEHFKFTGGVFENTDGVADYTDDIDIFGMGVFIFGEGGAPFSEPEAVTNSALTNGFLTDAVFGPLTVQFLLAPNYSKESASGLANGLLVEPVNAAGGSLPDIDADKRFFRYGGRVSADIGVGTVSALFKTFQWPIEIMNTAEILETGSPASFPGSSVNFMTFGAYADITAVENLGISLGYTGFAPVIDDSDYNSVLWSGIDLRAAWTGIEGLSISTHHNFSFASGVEDDWMGSLDDGDTFFTLFNAIGATKELTEIFSVNAEIANVFSKTDSGGDEIKHEGFSVGAKLITKVTENAEFKAGLALDMEKTGDEDAVLVFSIPIGIAISF
jgi:hypothetical protein